MKTVNKICQVLATAFSLAAVVMFFFTFAKFDMATGAVNASGLQLAFGAELIESTKIARSADILLCFWLSAISFVMCVATFFSKSKVLKYVLSGESLAVAIYMLVIALSNPLKFVDARPFGAITNSIAYGPFVVYAVVALFLAAVAAIALMLISDYLEVLASKGEKKPLVKRVIQFFKDYKSETKKIVWPKFKDVIKSTFIVLVMCLIIGALIWLVDLGLGSLLKAVW